MSEISPLTIDSRMIVSAKVSCVPTNTHIPVMFSAVNLFASLLWKNVTAIMVFKNVEHEKM
eukprot:5688048-Pleurochrysis_carterae.AAC.2